MLWLISQRTNLKANPSQQKEKASVNISFTEAFEIPVARRGIEHYP